MQNFSECPAAGLLMSRKIIHLIKEPKDLNFKGNNM